MALTTQPSPTTDPALSGTSSPDAPSSRGIAGWALVLTGAAAAAALLAIAVVQSGSDDPTPATPRFLTEQGSINAIEHADALAVAEASAVTAHRRLMEEGSIQAIDHRAEVGVESGSHSVFTERGSINAIEHADEAQAG